MLKKAYRLTKDRDFQKVYRRGQFKTTALFSLHYLPNRLELTRVGIVVSKKVAKKATERNLIKRRVRESIKEVHPKIKPGYDVIITIKKEALAASFHVLKNDLINLINKTELS